jgi:hypothetical protein
MDEEQALRKALQNVAMRNLMDELREAVVLGPKILGDIYSEYMKLTEEKEKPDEGYCQSCDGEMCTAKKGCVARDNPPQRREWVGLTDEEYRQLHTQNGDGYFYQDYGRDIEAKLKEKNHG